MADEAALIAVDAASASAPVASVLVEEIPEVVATQFHAQDEIGQYSYGYSNPTSTKVRKDWDKCKTSSNRVTQK